MSVSTTLNKIEAEGTSSTLSFPFKIFSENDLRVYKNGSSTPLTLSVDYTVSGAGQATGGSIALVTTPEATDTFLIVRVLELKQETSYPYNDPFPSSSHEDALDYLCMVDQQQQEALDRTFSGDIAVDWSGFTLTVPDPADKSGYALAINSGGTGLNWVTTLTGTTVTAFMATVLDDSDAATARATLGAADAAITTGATWTGPHDFTGATVSGIGTTPLGLSTCAHPTRTGSLEITFSKGVIEINGTEYTVPAAGLAKTFTSPGNNVWGFLYAAEPGSGTEIGLAELSISTTAPTWDPDKNGWYNAGGTARCPLEDGWLVRTDGSGNFYRINVEGNVYNLAQDDGYVFLNTSSPASSGTAVGTGAPSGFKLAVNIRASAYQSGGAGEVLLNNGDGTTSLSQQNHRVINAPSGNWEGAIYQLYTNTSAQIVYAATSGDSVYLVLIGFVLPRKG